MFDWKNAHPKTKGELTEQIIICELLKLAIPISKPVGDNQPYDLIMDINDKLYKVQSRTARKHKDSKVERIQFNCVSYRTNTKETYIKDNRDKFDYFALYYPYNDKVYLIKSTLVEAATGTLNFIQTGYTKYLAKDYELKVQLDKLLNPEINDITVIIPNE